MLNLKDLLATLFFPRASVGLNPRRGSRCQAYLLIPQGVDDWVAEEKEKKVAASKGLA